MTKKTSNSTTAVPPTPSGINTATVAITRPPEYFITISFEVNHPDAFSEGTLWGRNQNLDLDYGHAAFYITKDDKVESFFSFGPNGLSSNPGKMEDAYSGPRPANIDYTITEKAYLFRFNISKKQADKTKTAIDECRADAAAGRVFFHAANNVTCAERCKVILKKGKIDTPSASGGVIGTGIGAITRALPLDNPYMWHKNMVDKYGTGILFNNTGLKPLDRNSRVQGFTSDYQLLRPWGAQVGSDDPLLAPSASPLRVHGNLSKK